jgi:hypothetical protein
MRLDWITRGIRHYDRELYAGLSLHGVPCIFRRTKTVERHEVDECVIFKIIDQPHFVFALTDTWTIKGTPVDWGLEPILARLKECDLHKRDIAKEIEEQDAKVEQAKSRALRNDAEAFFSDERRRMAKSWNDLNLATVKSDKHHRRD